MQVVVVDTASGDDSADLARRFSADVVALPLNIGWSRACNVGAALAAAPTIAFVNPDARPSADDLVRLAARLDGHAVAAVAPRFVEPDGSPQAFYFRFPSVVAGWFCFLTAGQRIDARIGDPFIRRRTYDFARQLPRPVDQPGAACLLVGTDDFRASGGFNDDFFLFFADTDLCRRWHDDGRRVEVAWDVPVVHVGGGSVMQRPTEWIRVRFQRDYLVYLRHHHGRVARLSTKLMVVVLSGLVPFVTRSVRADFRSAVEQLRVAWQVLR